MSFSVENVIHANDRAIAQGKDVYLLHPKRITRTSVTHYSIDGVAACKSAMTPYYWTKYPRISNKIYGRSNHLCFKCVHYLFQVTNTPLPAGVRERKIAKTHPVLWTCVHHVVETTEEKVKSQGYYKNPHEITTYYHMVIRPCGLPALSPEDHYCVKHREIWKMIYKYLGKKKELKCLVEQYLGFHTPRQLIEA